MKSRSSLTVLMVCALLACDLGALAQGGGQPRVRREGPPPADRVFVTPLPGPEGEMPFHFETIAPGPGGEGFGFSWVSAEMSFEGKLVKGAPYSAEAVTETVQTLSDGNRITRKSTAMLYRDGEGRTRRDQTLSAIGPWATAEEPPRHVFINDPVSGTHYVLDPRSKIARQSKFFFRTAAPGGQGFVFEFHDLPPPSAPGAPPPPPADGAPPAPAGPSARGALKRVPPVYPEVAKAAGAQGTVEVEIVTDEKGEVISAKATKGHPLLHQASVDAARQWQFRPTEVNGKPAKVTGHVTFNFVLPPPEEGASALKKEEDVTMLRVPATRFKTLQGEPHFRPQEVKESLGKQTLEGVEAEGTRTTLTIPTGAIGNERAINILSERWYSPELQTVVMTKHSDPRFGETTYRLTNVNRGEPARTLFEVPTDYTLREDRPPTGVGVGGRTGAGGNFRVRRRQHEQ